MKDHLEICRYLYETQVRQLLARDDRLGPEELLEGIELAAAFASAAAPGLLADPRLEGLLNRIGRGLDPHAAHASGGRGRRRVLHVATEIYPWGGHSRILANWIATDRRSEHAVVLTRQRGGLPGFLRSALDAAGGSLSLLNGERPRMERARDLRALALTGRFDLVVLHHHPHDPIPVVAFSVEPGLPVLSYNHADHVFWLGTSIADMVIDFSPLRRQVSLRDRGARRSHHLPYVLPPVSSAVTREEAKKSLGMSDRRAVLVTVGTKAKLAPTREFDFFSTLGRVLDDNPDVILAVIGISDVDFGGVAAVRRRPNLRLLGTVPDLAPYALAGDIFVEPFPIGSGLASFEMCRFGAAPVFAYGKPPTIYQVLSRDMFEGSGADVALATAEDLIEEIQKLIDLVPVREARGARVAEFIEARCVGEAWLERVEALYAAAEGITHQIDAPGEVRYPQGPGFHEYNAVVTPDMRWVYWEAMRSLRGATALRDLIEIDARCLGAMLSARSLRGTGALLRFSARSLRAVASRAR